MKPKDVLDAAATRLTEEKAKTSGPHEATFLMIARLWTAYLKTPVSPPRRCRDDGHAESVPREVCAVSF